MVLLGFDFDSVQGKVGFYSYVPGELPPKLQLNLGVVVAKHRLIVNHACYGIVKLLKQLLLEEDIKVFVLLIASFDLCLELLQARHLLKISHECIPQSVRLGGRHAAIDFHIRVKERICWIRIVYKNLTFRVIQVLVVVVSRL